MAKGASQGEAHGREYSVYCYLCDGLLRYQPARDKQPGKVGGVRICPRCDRATEDDEVVRPLA